MHCGRVIVGKCRKGLVSSDSARPIRPIGRIGQISLMGQRQTPPRALRTSQHSTARPIIADSSLGGPLMLSLGRLRSRTCQGLTRRAILQIGASSVFGLSLADLLRCRAEAGERLVGTAKSVLLLWMWGGPSHLDTWDPKPNASLDYRGPFGSIVTKTPGLRVSELFPKIAKVSD